MLGARPLKLLLLGFAVLASLAGLVTAGWWVWPRGTASVETPLAVENTEPPGGAAAGDELRDPQAAEDGSVLPSPRDPPERGDAQRGNHVFSPPPEDPYLAPQVVEIWVPPMEGAAAIWGAIGRDDNGNIWYGVSTGANSGRSAHLVELDPVSMESTDRGNVLSELRLAGKAGAGDQAEIRTRIIQAEDGDLYFASSPVEQAPGAGDAPPASTSHLWRVELPDYRWQHVYEAPERLVALAGSGRWIYALGEVGHVLYQYDTQTAAVSSVTVGSIPGHVTRNFLADERGHAYVPRAIQGADDASVEVSLVEFDPKLHEVGQTPLSHDVENQRSTSHGIVAGVHLADQTIVFATHMGYLYRVVPREDGRAEVEQLGWFHPDGRAQVEALFTYAGKRYVVGVGRRGTGRRQWLVYNLQSKRSQATDFKTPDLADPPRQSLQLLGSTTRDDAGRFYLAGRNERQGRFYPLLLRIDSTSH